MAVISWDNYVDDSTITTSFWSSIILSANNLKTRQIGDIFRGDTDSSPLVSVWINFDLGSAKLTNLLCVLNHNIQGVDYQINFGSTQFASDIGQETGTFAAATTYDAVNDMLVFAPGFTARYISLIIKQPSPLLIDIGRIWIDDAWSYNNLMDFSIGVIDRSTKSKSRGGSTYSSSRQKLRRLDIIARGKSTADFIGTSADFDSFLTMDLAVGESGEIVVLPLTDTEHNRNRTGVYGTISNNNPIKVLDKGADGFISEKRFSVEEDKG